MSVTLSIANPLDDDEKFYHLAISTESGFHSVIEPIAGKYGLTLIDWGNCVAVTKENLAEFLAELVVLRDAIRVLDEEAIVTKLHYLGRLDDLMVEAERLIKKRPDIRLLVG